MLAPERHQTRIKTSLKTGFSRLHGRLELHSPRIFWMAAQAAIQVWRSMICGSDAFQQAAQRQHDIADNDNPEGGNRKARDDGQSHQNSDDGDDE